MTWLFMGVQDDPSLAEIINRRGVVRAYDGTFEPDDRETEIVRLQRAELLARKPRSGPKRGGFYPNGEGPCVCGQCFFTLGCSSLGNEKRPVVKVAGVER